MPNRPIEPRRHLCRRRRDCDRPRSSPARRALLRRRASRTSARATLARVGHRSDPPARRRRGRSRDGEHRRAVRRPAPVAARHLRPPRRTGRLRTRSGDRRDVRPPPARRRRVHPRVRRGGRGTVQPVDRRPPGATRQRRPRVRDQRPRHRRGPCVVDRLSDGRRVRHGCDPTRHPGALPRTGEATAGVHDRERAPPGARRAARRPRERGVRPRRTPGALRRHPTARANRRVARRRGDPPPHRHDDRPPRGPGGMLVHVGFAADSELSERVLWPHSPTERHGMEDARFVEITDDSGPSLLRDLHGLRRREHQAEPAHHRRLRHLRGVTDGR